MKNDFIITRVKLVYPIDVAGVPETYLTEQKFEIVLMKDPRFFLVRSKMNPKFPPTAIPLQNVACFSLVDTSEDEKK